MRPASCRWTAWSPVTGHLTLDQINEGFDRLARGEAIRQIIRMEA